MKNDFRWRVSKQQAGMRLLQFLRENCREAPSVKAIKRAIDAKLCSVNKRIETFSSFALSENDLVILDPGAFAVSEEKELPKAAILYEDGEILILNKPAGVLSENRALKNALPNAMNELHLVHRLDKETSGALIVAKTAAAKEKMIALFKERQVKKVYLAMVDGVVAKEEGTVDNFLGKKHSYEGQTVYGAVAEKQGERAVTHWKVLKRGKTATLLLCEPYTGRTHQLRVHLSGMGHPILGDAQYAKQFHCHFRPRRNLLHAYTIAFKHPRTSKPMKATAPIPRDFKEAIDALIG
jgi:RluA family pseudouridine synthase